MNKLLGLIAVLVSINGYAQTSETRNLSSFDEIDVAEAITVYMTQGNKEEAIIEVRGADPADVETDIIGDRLRIEMAGNKNYRNVEVVVYVTYKNINEIEASSASSIIFKSVIRGAALDVDVSSAASVTAEIEVDRLSVDISSSGDVELSGKAEEQRVEVSSAGDYNARDLMSRLADIDVSSSGDATVYVTEEINADASSAGTVTYKGEPKKVFADADSGGKVRKY